MASSTSSDVSIGDKIQASDHNEVRTDILADHHSYDDGTALTNSSIDSNADIEFSKMKAFTNTDRVLVSNGSGVVIESAITTSELNYLDGQDQALGTDDSPTFAGLSLGALDMGSNQINNVTDPTSAQDAATKSYVDDSKASIPYTQRIFDDVGEDEPMQGFTTDGSDYGAFYIVFGGDRPVTRFINRYEFFDDLKQAIKKTHQVRFTNSEYDSDIAVLGSYIYAWCNYVDEVRRYNKDDLSNETLMSFSGQTPGNTESIMYSDGTYLYIANAPDEVYKYSVSGTTLTYQSTISYNPFSEYAISDGSNVYECSNDGDDAIITKTDLTLTPSNDTTVMSIGPFIGKNFYDDWFHQGLIELDSDYLALVLHDTSVEGSAAGKTLIVPIDKSQLN